MLAWTSFAFCGEIHDAATFGQLEKVKALLQDNPDLVFSRDNSGGHNGVTPLHVAANKDVAELLLAYKADVNATNNSNETPLHLAAMGGHKDVAELLLANKANVNVRSNDRGRTPLHLAAMTGHKDVVELLLANGAGVDTRDNMGRTPLHWATFREVVRSRSPLHRITVQGVVLANKADINATNNSDKIPSHWAAVPGQKDVAELLLANKADVNATDNNGVTPLRLAAMTDFEEMVELLRQHGGHE
jgi:ankyrin repeat protein